MTIVQFIDRLFVLVIADPCKLVRMPSRNFVISKFPIGKKLLYDREIGFWKNKTKQKHINSTELFKMFAFAV